MYCFPVFTAVCPGPSLATITHLYHTLRPNPPLMARISARLTESSQRNDMTSERLSLRSMRRQYVHLSVDRETARVVGARRRGEVAILAIRAAEAADHGVTFYAGNDQVWLADAIPPEWIVFP